MSKTNTNTAKNITAPKLPGTGKTAGTLPLTDPRRKLTRDEWKTLSKEDKAARKAARSAQRGPAKGRFVKLVLRYASRFERMEKLFSNEKPIAEALHNIAVEARGISGDIDELAETWAPAGKAPKHNFAAGMHVVLTDAKATEYKAILGEEVGELEVLNAVGRRVVCKSVKGGVRFFLEARHIKQVVKA